MISNGEISIERHEKVARITLYNPARSNAISADMWNALATFCSKAKQDDGLRSVVISGSRTIFSAGADISGFEAGRNGAAASQYDDLIESTLLELEAIPQMVFAAISGPCMGAGASLACACDFRICESSAFFAVPAARLGLGYDPRGLARFTRIFGEPVTKEALLLAARISAERSYTVGAVQRLVEIGEALKEAISMAEKAAMLAPLTQIAAKAAVRELASRPMPSNAILQLAAAADASRDYAEGRAAFAEKRTPHFTGR